MEGFVVQGWSLILPGGHWLYEPLVGVSTPSGGADPGNHCFRPRFVGVIDICKDV